MTDSVFPVQTLDRARVRWDDYLHTLTPIERRGALQFKREDYFAPLGYGGINGAKLRQCIWLIGGYAAENPRGGVISAASVKSPQLPMAATVARHFGLTTTLVVGATTPTASMKHENVVIAARAGAEFRYIPVAYNPALQREVARMKAEAPDQFVLEYGITTALSDQHIADFHLLGSEQVRNFPADVETLVMPAGSCNSCVSVLYGLARFRPKSLRTVILIGIGPNRIAWIRARLEAIERAHGVSVHSLFYPQYLHNPELIAEHRPRSVPAPYTLIHHDLHTTKYVGYQDEMPFSYEGIDFHPTYEGKVMTYLSQRWRLFPDVWESGRSLFWIVGSKPQRAVMDSALSEAA